AGRDPAGLVVRAAAAAAGGERFRLFAERCQDRRRLLPGVSLLLERRGVLPVFRGGAGVAGRGRDLVSGGDDLCAHEVPLHHAAGAVEPDREPAGRALGLPADCGAGGGAGMAAHVDAGILILPGVLYGGVVVGDDARQKPIISIDIGGIMVTWSYGFSEGGYPMTFLVGFLVAMAVGLTGVG